MKKLSKKQRSILDYIDSFLNSNNYPPTVRDIMRGCGISSTSVVDYNLKVLEKNGHVRRRREVSRGIELIGSSRSAGQVAVPVLGTIAAGKPIDVPQADAWSNAPIEDKITVGEDLIRGRKGVYALRVKGTSMIEDLIDDGDIVLMQHTDAVDNGQTAAVWLKDEKEVTLKKFYAEPGRVRLKPANKQMKAIYTSPENAIVQGRVVAVIRKLG